MDIPCRKSELVIKDSGNKKVVQVVDGDHLNDDKMLETFSDILQKGNSGFGDTKTKVLKNLNTNFVVSTAKTEPLTVQKPLKVQKPTSNKSVPSTDSKTKDKSQLNLANKVDAKTGSFTISSKNSSACSVKKSSFISRKGDYVDLEQEYKFMDAQKKANDAADKNKPTLFKSMVFRKLDDASQMSQGDDTSNDSKPVLKGILKNNKEPVHVFPSAIGVPNLYNVTSLKGILKLTTETDETNTSQKYGAFKSILKSLHIKNKTEKTNLPIASIDDEKEIAVFESEASQNELELVEHNDVDLCSSEREAQLKASQIKDNIDQEDETDDLETCRSDVTVVAASNYHINDNVWSDFQPNTQSTLSRNNSTIKQVTPTHSDCSDANMNYQLSFQHVTEKILNSLFVNCCEVPVTPANSEMNFARPLSRVSSSSHVAQVDEDEETDLLTEIDEIDANDDDDGRLEYFMEPFEDTLKFFDDFDLDDEKELTMTMSDIGPTKNMEVKSGLEQQAMEALSHAVNKIDSRPFELMMTHSEMQPAGYIKNKAVLLANSRLMAKNTDLAKPFFDVAFESRSKMKEINREQQKEFLARQEFLEPIPNSSEHIKTPIPSRSNSAQNNNLKHQMLLEKYRSTRFPKDLELIVSDGLKSIGLLQKFDSTEGVRSMCNLSNSDKDPFKSYKEAVARTAMENLPATSKNSVSVFVDLTESTSTESSETSSGSGKFEHDPRAKFIQRLSKEIRDATDKKDLKAFAKQEQLEAKNFSRNMKDRKAKRSAPSGASKSAPHFNSASRNVHVEQSPKPKTRKKKKKPA
ncbi:uncharacterized protein LOC113381811, partial [Ctenocephalides felis]|uniref:uncharacterized protein LOC113381811 n=1 Tax=Ctenocephalides felis TaxID=7515 RepID=UPI000E6E37A8